MRTQPMLIASDVLFQNMFAKAITTRHRPYLTRVHAMRTSGLAPY